MQNKFIYAALLILLVGGGFLFFRSGEELEYGDSTPNPSTQQDNATTTTATATTTTPTSTTTPATQNKFSLSQVSSHKSRTDCWVTVNGGVYNLTTWIDQHPGGADKILALCGKDGSSAFNAQHGSSAQANATLASFKIGTLIQ